MPSIYLDESGDLGFKSSASKVFVIGAILCDDAKGLRRVVKRVRTRGLRHRGGRELKWRSSSPDIRERLLKAIGRRDIDIAYAAILWKERVSQRLQRKPGYLYNYLAYQVVRWLANRRRAQTCDLIVDRSQYGIRQDNFTEYIESNAFKTIETEWGGQLSMVPSGLNVKVRHVASQDDNGLQAADFVAGAIFHYWRSEGRDGQYYQHIEPRVCGQYLFPHRR